MTTPYIEAGDLVVIGLVQEQHPQRAMLYAQWQQIDWPILWDPFNTTGAAAVPNAYLIDEHGILRGKRLNAERLEAFMQANYAAPDEPAPTAEHPDRLLMAQYRDDSESYVWLISNLTFRRTIDLQQAVVGLENSFPFMNHRGPEALNYFQMGVALRMRYDSEHRQPDDFQAAIDAWIRALERDPNQYIWRRRIQQYGPMSDKPYPFYDWIETAQQEIAERGETPVDVPIPLTQAELATRNSALVPEQDIENPDPEGRVTIDEDGLIEITAAVAFDTQRPDNPEAPRHARVLLELRPTPDKGAHWNNEATPLTIWIDADSLPEGWSVESPLLIHPPPAPGTGTPQETAPGIAPGTEAQRDGASSTEPRSVDFGLEITPGHGVANSHVLTGYALYNVCEDGDFGQCLYLRQPFEIHISVSRR